MILDFEVYPKMPRKWSKAAPEGNSHVPHDEVGPDQPTMVDLYQMIEELFHKSDRELDELAEEMRGTRQRLAGLKQKAQLPRLAMEADVKSDTKTRMRMEDAVADQAKHGDRCSAKRIQVGSTSSTSFGMKAEPPVLPSRNDVLVDEGLAAPKLCISPVEMCTLKTAGNLLPACKGSTAMMIIFYKPPLWFC